MPKDSSQIPSDVRVSDNPKDWQPVLCLLDDDRMVTKLCIASFKLLTKVPAEFEDVKNYVELDLDVIIHPITPMMGTLDMLFKG